METIKFETVIDSQGGIHLPEEFRHAYGKHARLVLSLPAPELTRKKGRQPGSARGILKGDIPGTIQFIGRSALLMDVPVIGDTNMLPGKNA